jgi:hypothetical protein
MRMIIRRADKPSWNFTVELRLKAIVIRGEVVG